MNYVISQWTSCTGESAFITVSIAALSEKAGWTRLRRSSLALQPLKACLPGISHRCAQLTILSDWFLLAFPNRSTPKLSAVGEP